MQVPTAELIRQLVGLELYDAALKELQYAQRAWGDSPAIEATVAWIRHEQAQNETAPERFDHLRGAINIMKRAYPQYLAAGGEELPPAVLEVIFPLDYWPLIEKYSTANGLDPYLMAALIAQESTFTADVRSSANAYGLMQLLPATGRRYARKVGIGRSRRASLTQPETNIRIGMTYFKDLVDRFGGAHYALASYNAGESRVVAMAVRATRHRAGRVHRRHSVSRDAELREADPRHRGGLPPPVRRRAARARQPEECATGQGAAREAEGQSCQETSCQKSINEEVLDRWPIEAIPQ